jgi:hypothetical protein
VLLDQVGPLLLDGEGSGLELVHRLGGLLLVLGVLVLLLDRLDGLRLDPGLGRVVHAAGQVTVGVDDAPRPQEFGE